MQIALYLRMLARIAAILAIGLAVLLGQSSVDTSECTVDGPELNRTQESQIDALRAKLSAGDDFSTIKL